MFRRLLLAVVLIVGSVSAATLKLGTNEDPPYQIVEDSQVSGLVTDLMQCGLDRIGASWQLNIYPWRRALTDLRNDALDIVFSLDDALFSDDGLEHSVPLVLEKWFWYSHSGAEPGKADSIAVVADSNQSQWLIDMEYWNLFPVYSLEAALKSLIAGRVDFVLADESSARVLLNKSLVNHPLEKQFYRFSTLSAYFSPEWVASNGETVNELNDALLHCEPVGMVLDSETLAMLEALAEKLTRLPLLSGEARQLRSVNSVSPDLAQLDKDWSHYASQGKRNIMMQRIMTNAWSDQLRQIHAQAHGLYTEFILTDRFGQNVGASHLSTDYYQGDEPTVIRVVENQQSYISPIYYDRSTEQFQAQISVPRFHEGRLISILIVGVDLQRAYQLSGQ